MQPHLLGGDVHAVPQPLDEEQDHPRVRVREANLAWCLASLTGVERGADQEHVPLAQLTNDLEALSLHRLDLSLLGAMQLVGAPPQGSLVAPPLSLSPPTIDLCLLYLATTTPDADT